LFNLQHGYSPEKNVFRPVKAKHWRGLQGIIPPQGAPLLEFDLQTMK
jgi:hypothetical protein